MITEPVALVVANDDDDTESANYCYLLERANQARAEAKVEWGDLVRKRLYVFYRENLWKVRFWTLKRQVASFF